jgi:hypothetical protein
MRKYGRNHGYILDGTKAAGVTSVLSLGMPKGGLVPWASKAAAACAVYERDLWEPLFNQSPDAAFDFISKAHERDRDAAANRGTEVHALAERITRGEEVEVAEELAGHVDHWIRFCDEWDLEVELLEFVVGNRTHRYMGRGDLLGSVRPWKPGQPDRVRAIIDAKTNRSGPFPEVALQLAAYRRAEFYLPVADGSEGELPMPAVDTTLVVWLREDDYEVFEFNTDDSDPRRDPFRTFLYVKQVAEFLGEWRNPGWGSELKVGPLVPLPEGVSA